MSMLDHSETCNKAPVVHTINYQGRSIYDDDAMLSDIEALEFEICETDGNDGLTWNEVQICEVGVLYVFSLFHSQQSSKWHS